MDDSFVNLGEEVILTLLWQSGASESVTVSMFCFSLSICYWLFKCWVLSCVCAHETERQGHITVESAVLTTACVVQTHTSIITVSVTRLCSPFGLELMVKLRTLLAVFIFTLKAEARVTFALHTYTLLRGVTFPTHACGVQSITMHWVSWPIRADCACRKEGLCRKWLVWERRGIEELQ